MLGVAVSTSVGLVVVVVHCEDGAGVQLRKQLRISDVPNNDVGVAVCRGQDVRLQHACEEHGAGVAVQRVEGGVSFREPHFQRFVIRRRDKLRRVRSSRSESRARALRV